MKAKELAKLLLENTEAEVFHEVWQQWNFNLETIEMLDIKEQHSKFFYDHLDKKITFDDETINKQILILF